MLECIEHCIGLWSAWAKVHTVPQSCLQLFFLNGKADHPNNHKMAQLDRVHAKNIPAENQINLKIKSKIFCAVIFFPILMKN